ncbi:MAG: hypothetical protein WA446_14910 [Steroidobacteraceae bacterium]
MKPIPNTPQTLGLARNVIWFEPPEKALADPIRFMAYAMTYALPEDMHVIRQYVSDDDFREALDHAPAGIIDPRSWVYWNSKMGRYPPPPLPVRRFGIAADPEDLGPTQGNRSSNSEATHELTPANRQRDGSTAWQKTGQQEPSMFDLEEVHRRAREEWRAKYGPKDKA